METPNGTAIRQNAWSNPAKAETLPLPTAFNGARTRAAVEGRGSGRAKSGAGGDCRRKGFRNGIDLHPCEEKVASRSTLGEPSILAFTDFIREPHLQELSEFVACRPGPRLIRIVGEIELRPLPTIKHKIDLVHRTGAFFQRASGPSGDCYLNELDCNDFLQRKCVSCPEPPPCHDAGVPIQMDTHLPPQKTESY